MTEMFIFISFLCQYYTQAFVWEDRGIPSQKVVLNLQKGQAAEV